MVKNFIDLFCGAGGMSLGFERAGFKCVGAIDISKACVDTHKINFPDCVSINVDISKIKPKGFEKKISNKKIDLIIGGPPCPTFSTIGHAKIKSIESKKKSNFTVALVRKWMTLSLLHLIHYGKYKCSNTWLSNSFFCKYW